MTLTLHAAAVSDPGLVRDHNEDSYLVDSRMIAVADGMAGPPAGEVASDLAIGALREVLLRLPAGTAVPPGVALDCLAAAVDLATARIRATIDARPELDGMGTTLTAMLVNDRRVILTHVGDSRAYLLRDGLLHRLTVDDTYVQLLVEQGAITPEEATRHPHRSVVTRVVQGEPVHAVSTVLRPYPGDRYLLCSDGLSDVVGEEMIRQAMRANLEPQVCAQELVGLALHGGGPDNVTAVVATVRGARERGDTGQWNWFRPARIPA